MQGGGAGVHRHRVSAADVAPKGLLEAGDARAGADPAGPQGRDHLGDLGQLDGRTAEDQEVLTAGTGRRSAQ